MTNVCAWVVYSSLALSKADALVNHIYVLVCNAVDAIILQWAPKRYEHMYL